MEGTLTYTDGSTFTGTMCNNILASSISCSPGMRLKGTMKEPDDGYSFEGTWLDNKKAGMGVEKFTDGTSFHGMFENDMRHGLGR